MSALNNEEQKARVRRRIRAAQDPDSYSYTPAIENTIRARAQEYQRVVIYARVSTLNPLQTSSFELQQKYYTELVGRYPKWVLIRIYADEGKSGVTTEKRDEFNEMMRDGMAGKFDLIIVKNISRLARNSTILMSTVRRLAEKKIGIFFESEAIYSLSENCSLALKFQADMAEEESRIRSRSMESSLRMRLDHGLPLTPELLGFMKDEDGKLVVNPETYKIPKLMFYMYLYGYSTQQIADTLTKLCKRTYLGNLSWSAGGVAKTLQNERYCGDVKTRKRFKVFAGDLVDKDSQKTFKNMGEKPQSYYKNEHEAIISRDDFLAVQRIMFNAKYGGTSLLPELRVIPEGLLKGFVIIHPKWASFTEENYTAASRAVDSGEEQDEILFQAKTGDFDLRHYEVVNFNLFEEHQIPSVLLQKNGIRFNASCVNKMDCGNYVELLVHPTQKRIAIRPTTKENRYAVQWSTGSKDHYESRSINGKAFISTLYQIFGWPEEHKYRLYGCVYKDGKNSACIFTGTDISVYIDKEELISKGIDASGKLLNQSGKCVRAFTGEIGKRFGRDYYVEKSMAEMVKQTKAEWQTRIEGQLCPSQDKLNITPYDELKAFIQEELGDLFEEVQPA